jgi:hypothetical protein
LSVTAARIFCDAGPKSGAIKKGHLEALPDGRFAAQTREILSPPGLENDRIIGVRQGSLGALKPGF